MLPEEALACARIRVLAAAATKGHDFLNKVLVAEKAGLQCTLEDVASVARALQDASLGKWANCASQGEAAFPAWPLTPGATKCLLRGGIRALPVPLVGPQPSWALLTAPVPSLPAKTPGACPQLPANHSGSSSMQPFLQQLMRLVESYGSAEAIQILNNPAGLEEYGQLATPWTACTDRLSAMVHRSAGGRVCFGPAMPCWNLRVRRYDSVCIRQKTKLAAGHRSTVHTTSACQGSASAVPPWKAQTCSCGSFVRGLKQGLRGFL